MSISSDYSLADIAAATGNNGNNNGIGWGGDWSAWIIIFLIFAAFGWGGNGNGLFGGGSRGAADNYVLASDFSMLSRQMSDGFASQERKLDSINFRKRIIAGKAHSRILPFKTNLYSRRAHTVNNLRLT